MPEIQRPSNWLDATTPPPCPCCKTDAATLINKGRVWLCRGCAYTWVR